MTFAGAVIRPTTNAVAIKETASKTTLATAKSIQSKLIGITIADVMARPAKAPFQHRRRKRCLAESEQSSQRGIVNHMVFVRRRLPAIATDARQPVPPDLIVDPIATRLKREGLLVCADELAAFGIFDECGGRARRKRRCDRIIAVRPDATAQPVSQQ
jgi:hypothetical protein